MLLEVVECTTGSFSGLIRHVFLAIPPSLSSSGGMKILVDGRVGEGCRATNVSASCRCVLDFSQTGYGMRRAGWSGRS
jgi:hypothetical protein